MPKFASWSLSILFLFSVTTTAQERFGRYQRIEAYEVRPGILMMPRYTAADQVCEIGIERLQYSPTLIRLDSDLSREEIFQILDEVVPVRERGNPSKDVGNNIIESGQIMTTNIDYENVLIRIYGATLPSKHKNEIRVNEVVATVRWKHRVCR